MMTSVRIKKSHLHVHNAIQIRMLEPPQELNSKQLAAPILPFEEQFGVGIGDNLYISHFSA